LLIKQGEWVKILKGTPAQVENGGLFKRLHNLESSNAKAHKKWKQEQLATLVEPSSKHMLKDLDVSLFQSWINLYG
jgi:hypothetical protein